MSGERNPLPDAALASRAPRPAPAIAHPVALAVLAVAPLAVAAVLAGCASSSTVDIESPAELSHIISRRDKPVLVSFYKWGCPTCVALDPGLMQLADEYRNRMVVVRYLHMYPWFQYSSLDVQFKYFIPFVPTVILFVNGRERHRWVAWYYLPTYRKVIDKALLEMTANRRAEATAQPKPRTALQTGKGVTDPTRGTGVAGRKKGVGKRVTIYFLPFAPRENSS